MKKGESLSAGLDTAPSPPSVVLFWIRWRGSPQLLKLHITVVKGFRSESSVSSVQACLIDMGRYFRPTKAPFILSCSLFFNVTPISNPYLAAKTQSESQAVR